MSRKTNKNALVHGVYASDIVLPSERPEDFEELLRGYRLYFEPIGTVEDEIVFGMTSWVWKKRRIQRWAQLRFLQSKLAVEMEKTGKRTVPGIHRSLKAQRAQEEDAAAHLRSGIATFAESLDCLVESAKAQHLGKMGSNLRGLKSEFEGLRPQIEAYASQDNAAETPSNRGSDDISRLDKTACAMEERIDAVIEKKVKQLIVLREFRRQYGPGSTTQLLEHRSSTAKDVSPKVTPASRGRHSDRKKSDANNNWNNNDDNNNNNNCDKYDWPHEYDEAMAEKKAKSAGKGG